MGEMVIISRMGLLNIESSNFEAAVVILYHMFHSQPFAIIESSKGLPLSVRY